MRTSRSSNIHVKVDLFPQKYSFGAVKETLLCMTDAYSWQSGADDNAHTSLVTAIMRGAQAVEIDALAKSKFSMIRA